jgi:tetratricopeptide (TPR) repeat protein
LAYQRGRYYWNRRTEKDLHRSIKEFDRALSIQPDFALAHAGIANVHLLIGIFGLEASHTAFRMARRAADRALELDSTLVEARTCVAEILKDYDWDWPGAEREFLRAITLRPDYSTAHHWYAHLLAIQGRHAEALSQMQMARLAEPLSASVNSFFPYIYLVAGDYTGATTEAIAAVELEPYSALAHWELGRAYLFAGAGEDALTELAHASSLAERLPMWEAELGFARAVTGDKCGARNILNELMDRTRRAYVSPYDLAVCFAGLGENALALDYLERAYQDRVMRIINIGDPEFSTLRREPQWTSLMQRLQLPSL